MKERPFWVNRIQKAWETRSVIWLSGVRRVGKTTLSKMFKEIVYLNCDLPSIVRRLEDPESFLISVAKNSIVIFDEIHRLEDPSRILKIAADEFPDLKILATGSSTLEATRKFKDSLTGRKNSIYLSPILWDECKEVFNIKDIDLRLLRGGLPESLLSENFDETFFSEWIDSYYARDIQELFNVRNRSGFIKLMHLLFRSSGNLFEYTQLAKMSGLTRPTVMSYIEAMRISNLVYILPPFHGGGRREIVQRPKFYCFDTGLISFIKGWHEIRPDDRGLMWEHLVLDMLRTKIVEQKIHYWRDKSGHEIDFVIKQSSEISDIIECKVNPDQLSISRFRNFRGFYPNGKNYCFSPMISGSYVQNIAGFEIHFIGSDDYVNWPPALL
ncbi:MAG: ATP-binding protein [Bacteroidales bacterium]|nr:ATP-binding protein [Bacteroidales bacterium]